MCCVFSASRGGFCKPFHTVTRFCDIGVTSGRLPRRYTDTVGGNITGLWTLLSPSIFLPKINGAGRRIQNGDAARENVCLRRRTRLVVWAASGVWIVGDLAVSPDIAVLMDERRDYGPYQRCR
jgi:hypothetical protein